MSLCINPNCQRPDHPQNSHHNNCQDCESDLVVNGRYRVTALLSNSSGFGKIYTVLDQNTTKILKVLQEQWNDHTKAIELFEQEAEVLKQLKHPGIPQVDGYFSYQTSQGLVLHCLVMEKIEGLNLEQWFQKQNNQPISQEQAIDWLKQLAEILDLVHKAKWFHRDIKPLNIMLRNSEQLVLIDFGLAREQTESYLSSLQNNKITRVYTPEYAPEEQRKGRAVPQSDFYALGRTFVYLLTGQSPSSFDDNDRKGVLLWRKAANISPTLADLIDNLMAKMPENRPLDTEDLLKKIEDVRQKLSQEYNKFSLFSWIRSLLGSHYSVSKICQSSATASQAKKVDLKNVFLDQTLIACSDASCHVKCLAISRNNSTLVSGGSDNTIKIWNLQNKIWNWPKNKFICSLPGHSHSVDSLAISPDGQTLASGSGDKTIKIWNLSNKKLIYTLSEHSQPVSSVAISLDGQTIVSGSYDNTIKVWSLSTKESIRTFSGHSYSVQSVAISPDGQTLVSGSSDKVIKIWNLGTEELIHSLSGHAYPVLAVAISPDGQILVSGSDDNTIRIWNLRTGEFIDKLSGHSKSVLSVAISPDGQTLISGSRDNTIKIWNLITRALIRTLFAHSAPVTSVEISPDGQTLVSGDYDGKINIWRVPR